MDNCADEHVCSPADFGWVRTQASKDPNLEAANCHRSRNYGEGVVKMKLKDGRNIIVAFHV